MPKKVEFDGQSWVLENHEGKFLTGFSLDRELFQQKSPFQKVEVVESKWHGRMLFNDDLVMISEKDEFVYHEMMAHVPMFAHPNPKSVLIIGGGDGGTAREVLRHQTVEHCTMVEIDKLVCDACREFIPQTASVLSGDDERLELIYEDGVEFVKNTDQKFDIILIDSTDPVGPAQPLFGNSFYESVAKILSEDGIVVSQGESIWFYKEMQSKLLQILNNNFNQVGIYNFNNITYPGGMWSFTIASKKYHPVNDLSLERVQASGLQFQYYGPMVHRASFVLPQFMYDENKSLTSINCSLEF